MFNIILYFTITLSLIKVELFAKDEEVEFEPILRGDEEIAYPSPLLIPTTLPSYPWEVSGNPHLKPITHDHFRCQGRRSRNPKPLANGETQHDCDGTLDHGLPPRFGKESVQPILVELLNYLQEKTQAEVVVTAGHRCPRHQLYINSSPKGQASKHQIGAEVTFYVREWEEKGEEIVALIENFYKESPRYEGRPSFQTFKRWDRETDVRTTPWYNEEIFVKYFQSDEGREEDNAHSYPYLDIQVRFDWEKGEKVQYTWKSSQEFFR